jgi:hypothetical protein
VGGSRPGLWVEGDIEKFHLTPFTVSFKGDELIPLLHKLLPAMLHNNSQRLLPLLRVS